MSTQDLRFAEPKAPREQLVMFARCLDEVVPVDAPVRRLEALLCAVDWRAWERAYAGFGQPPIHPRYLAGAILFGLLHKVRSSRDLEEASCKHLDFIWLLEGFTPDHSTFANFRLRHAGAIEALHKDIARILVMKREKALLHLIIDGTRLRADSSRQGTRTAKTIEMIIGELDRRMAELNRNDAEAAEQTACLDGMEAEAAPRETLRRLNQEIAQLQKQRAQYQKALGIAKERDARARAHHGQKAKPVRVPLSDPESQVTPNKDGGHAPNYTPVATIESQTGAIVHADVLPGSNEASAVLPAVRAAQALSGKKPDAILADSNFVSGPMLETLDAEAIDAYMPTRSASPPDNPALRADPTVPVSENERKCLPKHGGKLARTAFVYDRQADCYHCPMGHPLTPFKHGKNKDGAHATYYQCTACPNCPLAPDCIKGKGPTRTITRDEYEPLREAADRRMAAKEGKEIYKARAPGIEGVFGIIKSCFGIRRFTLRGLANVRTEWTWICTAYNIKKLLALQTNAAPPNPKSALQTRHPAHNRQAAHAIFARMIKTPMRRVLQASIRQQRINYAAAA